MPPKTRIRSNLTCLLENRLDGIYGKFFINVGAKPLQNWTIFLRWEKILIFLLSLWVSSGTTSKDLFSLLSSLPKKHQSFSELSTNCKKKSELPQFKLKFNLLQSLLSTNWRIIWKKKVFTDITPEFSVISSRRKGMVLLFPGKKSKKVSNFSKPQTLISMPKL